MLSYRGRRTPTVSETRGRDVDAVRAVEATAERRVSMAMGLGVDVGWDGVDSGRRGGETNSGVRKTARERD